MTPTSYKTVLGKTQMSVTRLAFGCWAMGGYRWGWLPPEEELLRTLKSAVDLNVDLFDTAPIYGFGHSETLVGRALGKNAPWPYRNVKIATKFGLVWDDSGRIQRDATAATLPQQVEASLRRLKRETIDLLQLHWPDPKTPIASTIEALQRLQIQGKIRHFGASNLSLQQLKEAEACGGFATLQPSYSLLDRQFERELLPYCQQKDLGVLVYSPLAKGLLSGKYALQLPRFGKNDVRRGDINFQEQRYRALYPTLQQFAELAIPLKTKPAALALAWLLKQKGVHLVIAGIKNVAQLQENISALHLQLDPEVSQKISALFAPEDLALQFARLGTAPATNDA